MDLSRMIRTTKVLVVAFALAMPAGLPARAAESDGFRNVETRTRHVRIKHRSPITPGEGPPVNNDHRRFLIRRFQGPARCSDPHPSCAAKISMAEISLAS